MRHESRELLEVDLSVAIEVGLGDHGPDLGLRKRFSEVGHGQPQLLFTDQTVSVAVKHFKGVSHVVIETVSPLHHHVNKLIDVFLEFPIVSAGKQNQRNKQIYWFAAADWF